jgi:hypothetical protein
MINKIPIKLIKMAGICLGLFLQTFAYATGSEDPKSIFDVMNHEEVLDITIETDLDSIRARRKTKEEELATILSFRDEEGKLQEWEAQLSLRGKFRRMNCDVPPLKVDFKKSDLEEAGLQPYDDFEIVTQCVEEDAIARELLLKEYLAYRLYNEITDYSYRVQLVRITFKNPETGAEVQQWGFLIEDTAQLSARLQVEEVERMGLPVDSFHQDHLKVMTVFQHMIGNADWDLTKARNVKFFRKKEGRLIPIAYDFDFSGLVDAPYAYRPNDTLRFAKPSTYIEPLQAGSELEPTLRYYQSKRKSILTLVRKLKLLPYNERKTIIDYLEAFFKTDALIAEKGPGI